MEAAYTSKGVRLRKMDDTAEIRDQIQKRMMSAVGRYVNGAEYGNVRLKIGNLHYTDKERFSSQEVHEALADEKFLSRRLRGDVTLEDKETGEVLDSKPGMTLMRVPYMTDMGTMIYNGSSYPGISQSRLLPGAYSRRRENGELETHFNTRPGTGPAMRLVLHPETAQYRLKIGTSNVHAYSVMKDLGVTDDELAERWGPDILEMNQKKYDPRAVDRAFEKGVPKWKRGDFEDSREGRVEALTAALDGAQIAKNLATSNLPTWGQVRKSAGSRVAGILRRHHRAKSAETDRYGAEDDEYEEYVGIGVNGLLAASDKLLAINRGEAEPDHRDSLANDRIYTVDRLMAEKVKLDDGRLLRKFMGRAARHRNLQAFQPNMFGDYARKYLVSNPLASPAEQVNPTQNLEQMFRITKMGPGGIGDENTLTSDMQAVGTDQMGFIDTIAGPESSRAGIDVRLVNGARVGDDGRIYQRFFYRPTGKVEWVSPVDLQNKTVKLPD